MSGLQGLIGYEGCCCGEPPCPSTLCGLDDTANNGSIRRLEMPPLFDVATSFTLSVASSALFGCVHLTPYGSPQDWLICGNDAECCCGTVGAGDCISGGFCDINRCEETEYGDYHSSPNNYYVVVADTNPRCTIQAFINYTFNQIVNNNLAQINWTGDFTDPSIPGCPDLTIVGNGCDDDEFCTTPEWLLNYFPMVCAAILDVDGSVGAPANTNFALITSSLRILNPDDISFFGVVWNDNRPTCDCKCPFMELTIQVSGKIFYTITDVYPFHIPPDPVAYGDLLPSTTTLTYRKRLVRSKALDYYTYYNWINDTTEPFHLFMIQSGEDGVHQFCERNAVDGIKPTCTQGPCPGCGFTGLETGSNPTYYIESYGSLCSNAVSETDNASSLNSASCVNYPDEIQLSITANSTPTITGISPSTGTTAGGTSVVMTGSGLWGCHQVTVGGTLAPSFSVNVSSTTTFGFTTPAHGAGVVQVVCFWSWGTTTTSFTYV